MITLLLDKFCSQTVDLPVRFPFSGFFSTEHRGEVAFMITLLLDKFCSQTVDLPVRISAGNALLEVVKPWDESLEMITAFLPGICCRVDSLASTDLNVTVVNLALKV
ncbi:unnamed protein product [Gongylonema pulchrum]|uniref:MMS19 nucleotide excision repair protein n=1 Tax=Gongylonema pulchrum TaxID=637853 RepID=A0A183F1K7_9BILA|nr:unnamed protein product [Gongylonema pulchrum]